ncbi:MAG: ATP-grasp domain-containing protein [Infirmifilum sp.]
MIPYEFELKQIISQRGIAVQPYCVASSANPASIEECLQAVKPPYVVKAQVRGWGRAKAGLISFAEDKEEARRIAVDLLSRTFDSKPIKYVVIAQRLDILRELYLSMMIEHNPPGVLLLASRLGGVDVESQTSEGELIKIRIDPFEGLRSYMVRRVALFLSVPLEDTRRILEAMYSILWEYNLHLLELNPLAVTDKGVVALDSKAIVDDDALELNPRLAELKSRYEAELTRDEAAAKTSGFSLVDLTGDVAVVGNGAGLTMATLDAVVEAGGSPGLFLDLGGGASAERVEKALSIVFEKSRIRRVLVNILGGITRCDEVALGAVNALQRSPRKNVKVVFRLSGFKESEGREILVKAGIPAFRDFEEAVKEVVS